MKGFLYIDNDKVDEVELKIIDEGMGGIGGHLIANDNYRKYQPAIQQQFEKQGISNTNNFNYRLFLENTLELKPGGGIGITDSADFDEIYVEATGLELSVLPII